MNGLRSRVVHPAARSAGERAARRCASGVNTRGAARRAGMECDCDFEARTGYKPQMTADELALHRDNIRAAAPAVISLEPGARQRSVGGGCAALPLRVMLLRRRRAAELLTT